MNTCVCCGKEIPEGRQICFKCNYDYTKDEKRNKQIKEFDEVTDVLLSRQPVATYDGGNFYV